jgi:hypothetical protein
MYRLMDFDFIATRILVYNRHHNIRNCARPSCDPPKIQTKRKPVSQAIVIRSPWWLALPRVLLRRDIRFPVEEVAASDDGFVSRFSFLN